LGKTFVFGDNSIAPYPILCIPAEHEDFAALTLCAPPYYPTKWRNTSLPSRIKERSQNLPFMRLLVLLFFFLAAYTPGQAQITIGLKGGGTIATVNETPTLSNITETGTISGLTGGVFLEFGSGLAVFRPEVLFQQRGYDYTLANVDSTFLEQFNYLDLPITLRLRFGKEKFRVYVEGGASLGFVIDGIRRASANGNSVETDLLASGLTGEAGGESRGYDLNGIIGAGLEFKLGPGRLSLGGRYNVDLNDLYDFKDQSAPPEWREVKWRSFDFSVGYGITLDFF
jgi:hypothetical protein